MADNEDLACIAVMVTNTYLREVTVFTPRKVKNEISRFETPYI